MNSNKSKIVTITGASGFLSTHLVKKFLDEGFHIRGTVRNPSSSNNDWIRKLAETETAKKAGGSLKLFKAELSDPKSFDEAFSGSDVVVHMAANTSTDVKGDPMEMVKHGIDGSFVVAEAATKAKVPRIVYTSSVVTIFQKEAYRHPSKRGKPFSEEEYRLDARPDFGVYESEKCISETVLKDSYFGELVVLCPSMVLGPTLNKSKPGSLDVLRMSAARELGPFVPQFFLPMVDVRDVASAHFHCCFSKLPQGQRTRRYICSLPNQRSPSDLAKIIGEEFKGKLNPASTPLPAGLLRFLSNFDSRVQPIAYAELPFPKPDIDNSRMLKEVEGFKYQYTDERKIVKDSIQSMIDWGVLQTK
jgi:dihydroflavonol-4-reductase